MRFAIRISKGITLSCCYPIQLSRNRRPRKGGNPARPPRPCQAGCFQVRSEPNPFDADTPTARICYWERTTEVLRFAACRDRGLYVPIFALSTTASIGSQLPDVPRYSTLRRSRPDPLADACAALFAHAQTAVQIRVIVRFPKIPYRSGTSQNDVRVGPIPPFSKGPENPSPDGSARYPSNRTPRQLRSRTRS
ncbi:MAG: hypothetical protein QOC81_958 [Thermoanaerobaculia bacterium]|jgi:hypothetical protein|nr:hypothetical protein [Thermoanaerobaculia bacterium]